MSYYRRFTGWRHHPRFSHDEAGDDTSTVLTLQQQVDEFWDRGWDLAYSPDPDGIRQASGRWWTGRRWTTTRPPWSR